MLSIQERIYFNGLRSDFYVSGRMLFLHDQYSTGAIMLGYAIESFLKQTLLELGNKRPKLQHSHDLKLLYYTCKKIGAFNDIAVPDDFIDYSNSLFQMRYPSTRIKESQKAYARNNTISIRKSYLFCYDDYFQQLDESLYKLTGDYHSSSILKIYAGLNDRQKHFGLYFNRAALTNYLIYKNRIKVHFRSNSEAIRLLENDPKHFWTDGFNYNINIDMEQYFESSELSKFKFPGNIYRDKAGKIIKIEI